MSKISKVTYKKNFIVNIMAMQHEHFSVEIDLNEGDDAMEAIKEAKKLVHEAYQKTQIEVTTESQSPEPAILPVIKEKKIVTTMGFSAYCDKINSCTTIEELEKERAIADMNPKLKAVFNEKLKTFTQQ